VNNETATKEVNNAEFEEFMKVLNEDLYNWDNDEQQENLNTVDVVDVSQD